MMSTTYDRAAQSAAEKAAELAGRAGARVEQALADVEVRTEQAKDLGRDAAKRAGEVADNMKGAIDKSLQDQPMTTLVMAAGVGFLLGALWKS